MKHLVQPFLFTSVRHSQHQTWVTVRRAVWHPGCFRTFDVTGVPSCVTMDFTNYSASPVRLWISEDLERAFYFTSEHEYQTGQHRLEMTLDIPFDKVHVGLLFLRPSVGDTMAISYIGVSHENKRDVISATERRGRDEEKAPSHYSSTPGNLFGSLKGRIYHKNPTCSKLTRGTLLCLSQVARRKPCPLCVNKNLRQ